jgi:hypothetical protein
MRHLNLTDDSGRELSRLYQGEMAKVLDWFHRHPAATAGILAGLIGGVIAVIWDLISPSLPQLIPYQDIIGRGLLQFIGIYLLLRAATRRGLLRWQR